MDPILCTTDTKGRVVWIAQNRRAFKPSLAEIKENGERYRIQRRTISAMGGSCSVWVMTIWRDQ